MNPTPVVIAHRGLHDEHPENSLAAFRAAWDADVEWCECDVRMTSCFTPVVIHDQTLDRMTSAVGRVDQARWATAGQARLRRPNGLLSEHTLPALRDVLPDVGPRRRMLVEIKPDPRPSLVSVVAVPWPST